MLPKFNVGDTVRINDPRNFVMHNELVTITGLTVYNSNNPALNATIYFTRDRRGWETAWREDKVLTV